MSETIKNLKIGIKLYIMVGIALAGMIVLCAISIMLMGNINSEGNLIAVKWMPSCTLSNQMNTALADTMLSEERAVTAQTVEKAQANTSAVTDGISKMDSYVASYGEYVSTRRGGDFMRRCSPRGPSIRRWTARL